MRRTVLLALLTCALTALPIAPATAAATDEPADRLVPLAGLTFVGGTDVEFARGAETGDFVLRQWGEDGVNAPVVPRGVTSLLDAYLKITPVDLPVPAALLDTADTAPPGLAERRVVDDPVTATDLAVPEGAAAVRAACWKDHFATPTWSESYQGMAPREYRSTDYGGRFRFAGSAILNCTPKGSPSDLWAKHRMYRSNAAGITGIRLVNTAVPPGGWNDEVIQGFLAGRFFTVRYNDGWNSSPNCTCQYHRQGVFTDHHP
ncbi:hypothetical protein FHX81_5598 [Saccharothrix saharensis]|uniref:Uncharacterized protein n=1 Tax=Saccharothrix saharensis TaxID=571190 RepID=A0A543JJZ4_9PSEU|nr:hypothetical protein [Saccharothrix saharensis]TQM83180.1 hypothetical protein FHX81_5598 [Saccharothrix saharensis]